MMSSMNQLLLLLIPVSISCVEHTRRELYPL